ncbi:GAF domain-containing protein [Flaviaesturariibacter aridisoli]|uniref:GAF domain-containing protein n=1 Tax=Flaviaesturariibacter aridisoli TaxID=2545761 RepID=A0A4R4E193_9BACT|nr:GAF domain-containing protein [Flaviaesturariibacter aridisoli]TCZ71360.1 GAF domain-containing protein [Flaviaesturariibacter aridisoli]
MNFDSEFCGRVPLNQTNLVQPHGVLLVVESGSWRILQCSENSATLLGIEPEELAGSTLHDRISAAQLERLAARLASVRDGKFPLTVTLNGHKCLLIVEPVDGYVLMEVEKLEDEQATFVDLYEPLKYAIAAIESAEGVVEASRIIARELKAFSGFDKVMIYRFDKEWNGEVIAEEKEAGMESYLYQFFPASDIPKQARELYRKNPYRLIPNVDYTPIRLYPVLNPLTHSFTDLSNSNLRSVASVHIEYLRNMQVTASMSTRILKNGKLWGLIACHHRSPRYLSYQECSVFEMLSTFITAKIGAVEDAQSAFRKAEGHAGIARVTESVFAAGNLGDGLGQQSESLLDLLQADGVALVQQRSVQSWGSTPAPADVQDLVYWLQTHGINRLYQQPSITAVYDGGDRFAEAASGLLALPIRAERGQYLLAFRKEAVRRIDWGGNPNETVRFESDGRRYHPRHSFQVWQQTVNGTAPEWTDTEEQVAETFRQFLLEYTLKTAQV